MMPRISDNSRVSESIPSPSRSNSENFDSTFVLASDSEFEYEELALIESPSHTQLPEETDQAESSNIGRVREESTITGAIVCFIFLAFDAIFLLPTSIV